jgi:hypothetical protein
VLHDIEIIQRELPIDLLEPHCLTALPGSEDHQKLHKSGAWLDPDLNKYDLEHVTTRHQQMSTPEWEKLYRDAWKAFYSLDHIETVLRRASATGIDLNNMMVLLLWFHFCIVYEEIDPLQGGYLRRKYRRDRRPTLPRESPFFFYPRYAAGLVRKHFKMAQLAWRFHWFKKRLERDAAAPNYRDVALTPDAEEALDMLEVLTAHTAPHADAGVPAGVGKRKQEVAGFARDRAESEERTPTADYADQTRISRPAVLKERGPEFSRPLHDVVRRPPPIPHLSRQQGAAMLFEDKVLQVDAHHRRLI